VGAVHGPELAKVKAEGAQPSGKLQKSVDAMRADYEHQLDAKFAGARGFVDAILAPEELRSQLAMALAITTNFDGPHLGPYVLPDRI
jgi:acetyl-CoA carboxylase carboxyltransferase component